MNLMINPNEVRLQSAYLEKKQEEYEKVRIELIEKINLSTEYWKGKEADAFREKAEGYFKGLDKITEVLKEYSIMFKKASDNHENLDKKFANIMRNTVE